MDGSNFEKMIGSRVIVSWVVLLVLEIVVVGIFVWSGTYDIGADAPHWPATVRILDMLRDNSIARRDANESMPNLEDPTLISEGAMCTTRRHAPAAIWRQEWTTRRCVRGFISSRRTS